MFVRRVQRRARRHKGRDPRVYLGFYLPASGVRGGQRDIAPRAAAQQRGLGIWTP